MHLRARALPNTRKEQEVQRQRFTLILSIIATVSLLALGSCGTNIERPVSNESNEVTTQGNDSPIVNEVDVKLDEYTFILDANEVKPGEIIFHLDNIGDYQHQFRVVKVFPGPTFKNLIDMDNADRVIVTEQHYGGYEYLSVAPEGSSVERYEFVTVEPGEQLRVKLTEPIVASGYAFVCFARIPVEEVRYSHVLRGMLSEFNVR